MEAMIGTLVATLSLVGPASLSRRDYVSLATSIGVASSSSLPALAAAPTKAAPFSAQPGLKLNTGVNFPSASFGLQVYDDDTAYRLTRVALDVGYRNFFASVLARNQKGFARAVKDSRVPREELFICGSVLSNRAQGYDAAFQLSKRGCEQNMEAFAAGGLDYIDMIMLDYPGPDADSIRGQWAALEEMGAAKLSRSLAVSNFSPSQLDVVLQMGKGVTVPAVNQLPYGVGFSASSDVRAAEVIGENQKRGVIVQAWSPLRKALSGAAKSACAEIGQKYGKTAAQVGLRYIVDTGATFTTQTQTKKHFEEDLNIFDFSLTKEEVVRLALL
jgi:diketogulonate reductase-like aldo/keto reductase